MSVAAAVLVGLVRVYQWTVRPIIGPNCRFWPSCSEYAVEALHAHGAIRGSALAAGRVLRCNPWHPGGYDPVPPCGCAGSLPGDVTEKPAPSRLAAPDSTRDGRGTSRRKSRRLQRRSDISDTTQSGNSGSTPLGYHSGTMPRGSHGCSTP